jgi:hypothetical protein
MACRDDQAGAVASELIRFNSNPPPDDEPELRITQKDAAQIDVPDSAGLSFHSQHDDLDETGLSGRLSRFAILGWLGLRPRLQTLADGAARRTGAAADALFPPGRAETPAAAATHQTLLGSLCPRNFSPSLRLSLCIGRRYQYAASLLS